MRLRLCFLSDLPRYFVVRGTILSNMILVYKVDINLRISWFTRWFTCGLTTISVLQHHGSSVINSAGEQPDAQPLEGIPFASWRNPVSLIRVFWSSKRPKGFVKPTGKCFDWELFQQVASFTTAGSTETISLADNGNQTARDRQRGVWWSGLGLISARLAQSEYSHIHIPMIDTQSTSPSNADLLI